MSFIDVSGLLTYQEECFISAVQSKESEMIEVIWGPFGMDRFLLKALSARVARAIADTREPEIIRRFVKFGNIFRGENSVFDFIDQAVGCDDRELAEILTGGEKHYFRFCPRNPLPYCRSATMVQYLLEMGADPEYRG
jgi:hypothetical protein